MTGAEYQRMTLAQMRLRRWRTTRTLSNGYGEIPAGTFVEVTDKQGGFAILTAPCDGCGIRLRVSKVGPAALRDVTDEPVTG